MFLTVNCHRKDIYNFHLKDYLVVFIFHVNIKAAPLLVVVILSSENAGTNGTETSRSPSRVVR